MPQTIIIGQSPALQQVMELAMRVAKTNFSVFLSGESGVGKGVFARFIQQNSPRYDKPFVIINCAALPESTLEDELFGHEKGAFTGATARRMGKFEVANGGTLFLDEIGDMSLTTQAKILRVSQDKELERLGGNTIVKVNVRIISATNKDINQMVADGGFRNDLLYRLNTIPIEIPPLRDRLEDVPDLARYILAQNSHEKQFHPQALKALTQYTYHHNNIRELGNIIERAIAMAGDDSYICPEHLNLPQPLILVSEHLPEAIDEDNLDFAQNIAPVVSALLQRAMTKNSGIKTKAAKDMNISLFHLEKFLKCPTVFPQACLQYLNPIEEPNNSTADPMSRKRHQQCQPTYELDARDKKVLDLAKKEGKITNKMVQDKLKISDSTAHRLLSSLVKCKILTLQGNGRNASYVLAIHI